MISLSNQVFPAVVFTATGQTGGVIDLSPNTAGANGAYSCGNLTLTGVGLTTATFAVQGSSDGGQTYFTLPVAPVNSLDTPANSTTATTSGLYRVNLAGITHVRFSTSGTFTATSVSIQLTGSPNPSDS